ncbi:hypothetical protein ACVWXM_002266 [Bradyrhizobium sp. GM7.3]
MIASFGSVTAQRSNYLDLDPNYKDGFGNPLLRMTFDFSKNDLDMSKYCTDRAADIAKHMNPDKMGTNYRKGPYSIVPYQTTHTTGGTIMGADPTTSAVNRYLQSWDVPNVFVMGAGAFSAKPVAQSDGHCRSSGLLGGRCNHNEVSEIAGAPGPELSTSDPRRWRQPSSRTRPHEHDLRLFRSGRCTPRLGRLRRLTVTRDNITGAEWHMFSR